ncbi:MAG: tetratricopeptide repeat protein [Elusimicrobia bacterium]|nr:tetratricopeptide repeat protein [Elusimicrobiota bacterium]
MKRIVFIIFLSLYFSGSLYSSIRGNLSKGNSAFNKEKYDVALEKYKLAETADPNLPETAFNIGDVYFKTGAYEDALKNYEKATYSKDIALQGKAYYNMGNSLFRLGKLPEAIQLYKKALELTPSDTDAKFNIEFAQKKLKENIDKNSKQQDKDSQSQKDKDKDKGKEKDKGKDKENKKNEEKKQQEKDKKEEKKQGMSKEDAQRLLESTGDEKRPKEKANVKVPVFGMPEKDW